MTNKKESITITIPNNTTDEEIKNIRQQFKKDKRYKDYRINIIISGHDDLCQSLGGFLIATLK